MPKGGIDELLYHFSVIIIVNAEFFPKLHSTNYFRFQHLRYTVSCSIIISVQILGNLVSGQDHLFVL